MKTTFIFLLLLSSLSFTVCGQSADSVPAGRLWSLKECIDYALANNLTVQRSQYTVESSRVDVRQSQWGRVPSVTGSASYGYSWGRGLDPVSNSFISQEITSSNLGAQASLPLINGFSIHNSIQQDQKTYAASEYDLAKAKNDVSLNVANLFITVVFNKELVNNARFQLQSSQQQLERTRKQVAAGALARSEELNLDAQVAQNELTLVQQENALVFSILQLKQALQIEDAQPFDVEIPDISPENLILDQTREEIYALAKQSMPEIKSAELKIESSYYGVKAARGNYFPRLNLVGSVNTNYSSRAAAEFYSDGGFQYSEGPIAFVGKDETQPVYAISPTGKFRNTYEAREQFKDNLYRVLNLQLIIPIFNNYNTRASVQRSIISSKRAEIDAKEISNTLRQNVETAYNEAIAASKTYNSAMRQVTAREEAFRMMNQRYNAGAANSFEYQVSQNDLYQAQTVLTRAKYDFIFKKKVLEFYQGKSIDY
jgi:outer membrane protein